MLQEKETAVRRFLLLMDAVLVSLAYMISFFLREYVREPDITLGDYAPVLLMAVPLWCIMLYTNGAYRPMRTRSYWEILWIMARSAGLTVLSFGTLIFLFKLSFMSRLFFALFASLSTLLLLAERTAIFMVTQYVRKEGFNARRLLIVGTGRRAIEFIRKIHSHPEWGFEILGTIDDEPGRGIEQVSGVKVIGALEDIPRIFHRDAVDEVVFVVPRSRLNALEAAIHDCETEGVVVTVAVDLFDMHLAKSSVTELDGLPLLHFKTTVAKEWQLLVKRVLDILVSGVGLLLFSPFFLLVSLLIKLTSKGPVFFKQGRLGLHGRKFTLYKFRTMRQGAQEVLNKVDDVAEMDTPEFRAKKIEWITPLGRFLRKFSIDEVPQLINVFIGQMSLIGPRPTVPDEVEMYKAWQRRRFSMKPGITCLWQVNGRNKIGFEDWMKLDLEYLDNWSLWLDIKILAKTVPVVLFGIGAY